MRIDFNKQRVASGSLSMEYDEGLRSYMIGVYNHMIMGLILTSILAYVVSISPNFSAALQTNFLVQMVVMFAPLALVMYLSFRVMHMSTSQARLWFFIFSAAMGVSISSIFHLYSTSDITKVFFITAASFGALSLYGYTTKKDLTGWGSFLIMGLFGIIIASVVNWFLGSAQLEYAISFIAILIFAGLTAYDTQRIKQTYYVFGKQGNIAIMGALSLYLDFINLFLSLLRFMNPSSNN